MKDSETFTANVIRLANGNVLERREFRINGNFVIVNCDASKHDPPTWYNVNEVRYMRHVEPAR